MIVALRVLLVFGMAFTLNEGVAAASQVIVIKQYNSAAGAPYDLAVTPDGRLYGVSGSFDGAGTPLVDELDPPAVGQTAWTQKTVITMPDLPPGYKPGTINYPTSLLLDGRGRLFVSFRTVDKGYDLGAWIYQFDPPANGSLAWSSHLVLQKTFIGQTRLDSLNLQYADSSGLLYGNGGPLGTLQLKPDPLHPGIFAPVVISPTPIDLIKTANGSFYGGDLFQLRPPTPPQTDWTTTRLFTPSGDMYEQPERVDRSLNVYGVGIAGEGDSGDIGAVSRLSPPASGTTYIRSVLSQFSSGEVPSALAEDRTGKLFVVTSSVTQARSVAAIYKLVPRAEGALPFTRVTLATLTQLHEAFVPGPLLTWQRSDGNREFFGTLPGVNGYGLIYKIVP